MAARACTLVLAVLLLLAAPTALLAGHTCPNDELGGSAKDFTLQCDSKGSAASCVTSHGHGGKSAYSFVKVRGGGRARCPRSPSLTAPQPWQSHAANPLCPTYS